MYKAVMEKLKIIVKLIWIFIINNYPIFTEEYKKFVKENIQIGESLWPTKIKISSILSTRDNK